MSVIILQDGVFISGTNPWYFTGSILACPQSTDVVDLLRFGSFHPSLLIFVLLLWLSNIVVKSFCRPSGSGVFIVQFSDFIMLYSPYRVFYFEKQTGCTVPRCCPTSCLADLLCAASKTLLRHFLRSEINMYYLYVLSLLKLISWCQPAWHRRAPWEIQSSFI